MRKNVLRPPLSTICPAIDANVLRCTAKTAVARPLYSDPLSRFTSVDRGGCSVQEFIRETMKTFLSEKGAREKMFIHPGMRDCAPQGLFFGYMGQLCIFPPYLFHKLLRKKI